MNPPILFAPTSPPWFLCFCLYNFAPALLSLFPVTRDMLTLSYTTCARGSLWRCLWSWFGERDFVGGNGGVDIVVSLKWCCNISWRRRTLKSHGNTLSSLSCRVVSATSLSHVMGAVPISKSIFRSATSSGHSIIHANSFDINPAIPLILLAANSMPTGPCNHHCQWVSMRILIKRKSLETCS